MKYLIGRINFWVVLGCDILLITAVHYLAYIIRFEGRFDPGQWNNFITVLPFLLIIKLSVFYVCGLYQGMWRYTGMTDLLNVLKASILSFGVVVAAIVVINRFEGFSRSVFVLDLLLTFLLIGGVRIALRLYYQRKSSFDFVIGRATLCNHKKKLLIIGAGDAAEKVVREITDNRALPYSVVGFVDDNPRKFGNRIHGIAVLGSVAELHEIVVKTAAQEILIAVPSASREQFNRIAELCRTTKIPYKTVPGLGELINGKVSIKVVRDVSYQDLLGRQSVQLDLKRIEQILANRVVLVTGAGGSIGSELCRQVIRFKPAQIILFDASEHNLYQIEMEIMHEHGFKNYVTVLGQVQNKNLLKKIFNHYKPYVVFHAAAYKHVPMTEQNPWEAVYNNVFASKRLLETAISYKTGHFVLVSTDKAVRPTNVMGATKRLTEKLMQACCRLEGSDKTRFVAVRFGNVLGSSGSVIPLFRRQIELGGPVTVTDPEVIRYFMSIEEAAQLILQAAVTDDMGHRGNIFVLKMGTPIRIAQMARDLIKLCGKEPDSEIAIKYIGLRPGEKKYEELITEGENIMPTCHEKIMALRGNGMNMAALKPHLDKLKIFADKHDAAGIKTSLKEIIPEYSPQKTSSVLPSSSLLVDLSENRD